jgi:hypothetical protein
VIGPGTQPRRPNRALEVALGGIAAVCLILFGILIGQHTGINDGRAQGITPITAPRSTTGSNAITFGGSEGGRQIHNPFPSIGSHAAGVSTKLTGPARSSSGGPSGSTSAGGNPTLSTSASGGARAIDLAASGPGHDNGPRNRGSGGQNTKSGTRSVGGILPIISASGGPSAGVHAPKTNPTPSAGGQSLPGLRKGEGHKVVKSVKKVKDVKERATHTPPTPGNNGRRGPPNWSHKGGSPTGKPVAHPTPGNNGRRGPPSWSKGLAHAGEKTKHTVGESPAAGRTKPGSGHSVAGQVPAPAHDGDGGSSGHRTNAKPSAGLGKDVGNKHDS